MNISIHEQDKVHIIDSYEQNVICGCCKDIIEKDDILHITISCGHEYHYDCIFNAFLGNQNRGKLVLECPYCRKKVNPLPEKEGFNYNSCIHSGLLCYGEGNQPEYKWSNQHQGNKYCLFSKEGKYCNQFGAYYGVGKKYCWKHHNSEHIGENACKYFKNNNFCNLKVEHEKEYCQVHKDYINVKNCKYKIQQGKHKGELCNKYTFDNHCLCSTHLIYKDKINTTSESKLVNKIPCSEIIKSGINKGKICGVINCKRHNKLINANNLINDTKIIELKGINEIQEPVEVEKTLDNIVDNSNNLTNSLGEIKDILMNDIYPELASDKKNIIELLISKYFK